MIESSKTQPCQAINDNLSRRNEGVIDYGLIDNKCTVFSWGARMAVACGPDDPLLLGETTGSSSLCTINLLNFKCWQFIFLTHEADT